MTKHPDIMPDEIVRRLADVAREHGYGIENMTLTWLTRGLGQPAVARAIYAPDVIETKRLTAIPGRPACETP